MRVNGDGRSGKIVESTSGPVRIKRVIPVPTEELAAPSHTRSAETPVAIHVSGLRKLYGSKVAVDALSFDVHEGEVFALLGPNGAGKTTTIEILEGYRHRDGGEVSVLGLDPAREARALRQQIGLMLQEGGVYPQARPPEILQLFASFYAQHQDAGQLLDRVGLSDSAKTPYRLLSGGQKQRLSLAMALVGNPRLVFLDEPTAGMDPQARRATWDIINSLRDSQVTVLLTTHYMDEAQHLADHIGIVDRGRMVAMGNLESLRADSADAVRVVAASPLDLGQLAALPGGGTSRCESPGSYVFETANPPAFMAAITAWARDNGVLLREIRAGQESLEEIFLRLTGEEMR